MRVAAVQMDVTIGQPERNLAAMLAQLKECAAAGAKLICFPECALTGYCVELSMKGPSFGRVDPDWNLY